MDGQTRSTTLRFRKYQVTYEAETGLFSKAFGYISNHRFSKMFFSVVPIIMTIIRTMILLKKIIWTEYSLGSLKSKNIAARLLSTKVSRGNLRTICYRIHLVQPKILWMIFLYTLSYLISNIIRVLGNIGILSFAQQGFQLPPAENNLETRLCREGPTSWLWPHAGICITRSQTASGPSLWFFPYGYMDS